MNTFIWRKEIEYQNENRICQLNAVTKLLIKVGSYYTKMKTELVSYMYFSVKIK